MSLVLSNFEIINLALKTFRKLNFVENRMLNFAKLMLQDY